MKHLRHSHPESDVREQQPLNTSKSAVPLVAPAEQSTLVPAPASPVLLTRRPLSAGQIRAIFDVMRIFRDDDLSRLGDNATFVCSRCTRRRQLAGSLVYGDLRLCNGCATDYELLRTAGLEFDIFATDAAQQDV